MSDPGFEPHRLAAVEARAAAGRLGRIVAGYALGCLGAGVVRTFGLVAQEAWLRGFGRLIDDNGAGALVLVPVLTAAVSFLAASPFVAAFLMQAEARRARAVFAYVVAGVVIGPLTQGLVGALTGAGLHPNFGLVGLAALAGAVGGWLYWIVAVRSAPPPPASAYPPIGGF
jgi:hypothetical protein